MKKRVLWLLLALLLLLPGTAFAVEASPYRITVNLTENIVTVYGKDASGKYTEPRRAFACSAGKNTPTGTFRTTDKYVWRELIGGVYGQYATRITGHILFHSVPYFKRDKSTLEYVEYNKLGTEASAGCIRLSAADAKWIYDNCPSGTTVEMYREHRGEPIQPQTPLKIDTSDSRRGWDPTDPDPANPWGAWAGSPAEAQPDDAPPEWLEGLLEPAGDMAGDYGPMTPALAESRAEKREEAGLEAFWLRTARVNGAWTAKGRRTESDCFLAAQDAKRVYSHLGIPLLLPQQAAGNTANVRYQKELYAVPVQEIAGQAYYSLRALAEITGTAVERRDNSISLYCCGEVVRLDWAGA